MLARLGDPGSLALDLDQLMDELSDDEIVRVKEIEFADSLSAFTAYSFKPQLRTVGPKYGKYLGQIRNLLSTLDGNAAMDELENSGVIKFEVNGETITLEKDDLLIEAAQVEGFASESDFGITVVLDTRLSDELIEEGFVREIISKIQTMRKDADFNVTDRIKVYVEGNDKIAEVMNANADEIKNVVLANEFAIGAMGGVSKDWNINGEKVVLGVEVM